MKTIAHISDLHFGREDIPVAEALVKDLNSSSPDLIVVSGDLTQRARTSQFKAAAEYLKRFTSPLLIVPGNHDIPLFDLFSRFLFPLTRYKKYINSETDVFYKDEEMAVLGLNTARSFTWKNGRLSVDQIQMIRDKLCSINMPLIEIVVIHHQFIPPSEKHRVALVGRADLALSALSDCGVDLVLAGHLHHGYSGDITAYHPDIKRSIIVSQAGTAISHRTRSEPNAYNFITLSQNVIEISIRVWNGSAFSENRKINYKCTDKKWLPV